MVRFSWPRFILISYIYLGVCWRLASVGVCEVQYQSVGFIFHLLSCVSQLNSDFPDSQLLSLPRDEERSALRATLGLAISAAGRRFSGLGALRVGSGPGIAGQKDIIERG